jgi:hypothetical protein
MPMDTVLTVLNVVWGLILTGIGVEMVNNPPGDVRWKKWFYRILFMVFGSAVVVTTFVQSVRNANEQRHLWETAQRTESNLSNKVSEQGGKLDAIADLWKQFLASMPAQLKSAAAWGAYQAMAKATINIARPASSMSVSSPTDHPASQYGQLSDDQLIGAAKVVAEQMSSFRGEWKYQVEVEVGARYQNEREKSPTPKSAERIGQLWEEEEKARESVNQQYALKSKDLFARADDLRGVCADRVKKKGGQLPTEGNIADVFKRLATAGIDGPYGSNSDPDKASRYLLDVCKRLGPG